MIDTIEHLFLKGEMADQIWRYFAKAAGIIGPLVQVKQVVKRWWTEKADARVKVIFQVVPILILWSLWKRRNTILHRGKYSVGKVIWDITKNICKFMKRGFKRDGEFET